jgi:hypothetical protein
MKTSYGTPKESTSPSNIATASYQNLSSVCKTFQTTEMCEGTLSHLSTLELWRARLVCKTLQKVIDHSPLLQKNFFLNPRARNSSETISHQAWLDQHEIHPLLYNLERNPARDVTLSELVANEEDEIPNEPMLVRVFNGHDLESPVRSFIFKESSVTGIKLGDNSPLLNMYLSNPPCESVVIIIEVAFMDPVTSQNRSDHHQIMQVFNANGVTFRQVFVESKAKSVLEHKEKVAKWAWETKLQVLSLSGLVAVRSEPEPETPN